MQIKMVRPRFEFQFKFSIKQALTLRNTLWGM